MLSKISVLVFNYSGTQTAAPHFRVFLLSMQRHLFYSVNTYPSAKWVAEGYFYAILDFEVQGSAGVISLYLLLKKKETQE